MPQPDDLPPGAPCWADLSTSEPDRAQEFYCRLFGWTAEDAGEEYGGYINFFKNGQPVAGCMRNDGQWGFGDGWSVYLSTDDAEATAEEAAAHGGHVLIPVMEVMELGSMAFITDVGRAAIGIWQPGAHRGFGLLGEPGAPNWFELHTRNYDPSVRFYRDVFEWDAHVMSDTPEFRYTTLGKDGSARAGIMDAATMLREDAPAEWHIYFGVEDADAALATVTELGGSVLLPAEDTPYGRLAQAADATGARFKIVAS